MKRILMMMGVAGLAFSGRADNLLLSDNFNSTSADASIFNSTLAADQAGTLAPLNYAVVAGAGWQAQHGNTGTMLLTGGTASPNFDFAGSANTADAPLVIQFDMTNNGGAGDWGSFSIDSNSTRYWYDATKISILKRNTGVIEVNTNGVAAASMTGGTSRIIVVVSDTAGTGSAFNGNGTVVKFYNASTNLLGTYALAQMYPLDCYLSFSGSWWAGWSVAVDNLSISLAATRTVSYAGNGNTGGTAPTDPNLYYLGATATALGNTGGLVKTNLSFMGWNTAADGSGTSYLPGAAVTVTASTILYAQWGTGVSVFYDGNGNTAGSVPIDSNNPYPASSVVTVLGNTGSLAKTGQSFTNWNTAANGSGTGYNPGSTFTLASNTTLFAQWTTNSYTITYTAGANGTFSGTATQTVVFGSSGSPVTAMPNAGYSFVSWSDGVLTASRTDSNFTTNKTVTANFDTNLTWDNGGGTFAWNTTDTNWTGSVWNNSVLDSAHFGTNAGTITLTLPITAASLTFGTTSANSTGAFTGSALNIQGNLTAQANSGNGAGGPVVTFSNNVSVAGNVLIGRRVLAVAGSGSLTANQIGAGDAWGRLRVDGGTVTATNGVDDTSALAMSVFLNGGSLYTPYIKTTSISWTGLGNDGVVLNGGTLHATADTNDFIQTYEINGWGNRNDVGVGTNGAIISTDGHAVTLTKNLVNYGGGGALTKTGNGTLTLTGTNTYSGRTAVQGGVLAIDSTIALGSGAVDITNGAKMDLNYSGQIQVGGLTLNGAPQPNGTYGSSLSTATFTNDTYFIGTGVLNVYSVANQVFTWTGATDSNWDESTANWTNAASYSQWFNNSFAANSAIFDATGLGQSNVNVTLATPFYASNVTFNAEGYTIGGGAMTLGNTPDFVVNSNATISSVLQGAGGLTKTGNGTLTRSGEGAYTGETKVNQGALILGTLGGNTANGFLRGSSLLTIASGAKVQAMGANAFMGWNGGNKAVTINGGELTINDGVTTGGNHSLGTVILNGGTISGLGDPTYGGFNLNGTLSVTDNSTISAINTTSGGSAVSVSAGKTLNWTGTIINGSGTSSLTVAGPGTTILSGANAYTGNTTISGGTLFVNGSVASGATVSGGTLAGSGTIGGAVIVNTNSSLAAGAALNGIGTLTISSNLTLNGNVLVNLNRSLAQSNSLFAVSGVLTNANGAATTLTVSNLGPALAVGDKFTVFSQACSNGAAATIIAPAGVMFNNNLAVDGSISVAAIGSPTLGYVKSGSNLTFTWTGSGSLEWQTNALSKGLGTNWVAYPNGTNGVQVPIDPTKGSVFFRVKQ